VASRMTLTFPAVNRSREVAVLVSGEGKADVLARVFERRTRSRELAGYRLAPTHRSLNLDG